MALMKGALRFLDVADFGNHVFDLSEADFRIRMQESRFDWVASNLMDARSSLPFTDAPPHRTSDLTDGEGDRVGVGNFSRTVDSNQAA